MKIYPYVIELKKPSYRVLDFISQLMLLISLAAFFYVLFERLSKNQLVIYLSIGGIVGWWAYCLWQNKKGQTPYYRMGMFIAALCWWNMPNGKWICVIYLLAGLIEKQAKFPQEFAFDESEMVINSFPKKRVEWTELSNVVLKDGILTIDFKNNKLIQKEIQSGSNARDEQDFNEFCRNMLAKKD
jgi:hypothetical protein